MEIHKPKPFHDLREFLSEVLIIILGVSIALAAEQTIEALHWHHKIDTIEDAMRAELVDDDLPQAYARMAISHCLIGQLDALQALAKPGMDGARFHALAIDYVPPPRTWDNAAQQIARQSDLSAHMGAERMAQWASAYALIPSMQDVAAREIAERHRLGYARYAGRALTAADADALSDAIDDLRETNRATVGASMAMMSVAQTELGLKVEPATTARILAEARNAFGNCVETPNWDKTPGNDVQIITKEQRRRAGFGG